MLQILFGEIAVVLVHRAAGDEMHIRKADVEGDVPEVVEERGCDGAARGEVAFFEAIEAVYEPAAAFTKAFAHVVGGITEGTPKTGGVQHGDRLAPFEDVGVQCVHQDNLAPFAGLCNWRGGLYPFPEKTAVECMQVVTR